MTRTIREATFGAIKKLTAELALFEAKKLVLQEKIDTAQKRLDQLRASLA